MATGIADQRPAGATGLAQEIRQVGRAVEALLPLRRLALERGDRLAETKAGPCSGAVRTVGSPSLATDKDGEQIVVGRKSEDGMPGSDIYLQFAARHTAPVAEEIEADGWRTS